LYGKYHRNLFGVSSHVVVCGGMDRLDEAYSLLSQLICEGVCWHYVINACGIIVIVASCILKIHKLLKPTNALICLVLF
jgi:hypothetical protein